MRLFISFSLLWFLLPIVVLIAGITHVSPEAGAEFSQLCRQGQHSAQQWGANLRGLCRLAD